MTESVNAIQDLLANVAAFVIAHGALFDAAFLGKIILVHIDTKAWNTCFDSCHIEGLPATRPAALGPSGSHELISDGPQTSSGNKQIKAAHPKPGLVNQINLSQSPIL